MECTKIDVTLSGLSDIMFDKFIDHSKESRPPEQKLYLSKGNQLVLPSPNIDAFLFGENPAGCAKKFEGKKGKDYISYGMSHIFINPMIIPFKDDKNEPIIFENFKDGKLYLFELGGRNKSGSLSIKQEARPRPVLTWPWNISFQISLIKNDKISPTKLYNWFTEGGILIGIGTFRPRYGRFEVALWEEKEEK